MAKKNLNIQKRKQKNFSFNRITQSPKTQLQVDINRSLNSGDPIPAEIAERDAKKKNIPIDICKEVSERIRKGDYSVWRDPKYKEYLI